MNTPPAHSNGAPAAGNQASDELLPLVYDELRHLATVHLARERPGQTLQATALVHEAWLRLENNEERLWNNRTHFFRAAAQAMRRILVDKFREKASLKRGQHPERLSLDQAELSVAEPDERVLWIDEALTQLEIDDPESAQIVTLKFFGGFTNEEIAQAREVSLRTIERKWAYAKTCIFQLVRENQQHTSREP